ncbi:uncharacterized protein J8A68_001863 [[Candida] subhashii]|uniref:SRP9 domain-containing protein n=1 Tax=[Candida] subhashii TaxID=561895 RepID=A0A8J5UJK8_9ASCO|nr:uncharacterized protein J8A68_001863 [[Candida] subhashii]KAG7664638.1 hypothetical protein J8A68_001863 [[Candida] subhashii]
MPKISNIDSFIQLSSDLLATYPTTTTLSITYSNIAKKKQSTKEGDSSIKKKQPTKKASHSVSFKLFEPHTGKCIKYSTYKIKELSKILNFIGPRGIHDSNNLHVLGLSSLMTNVKYEATEDEGTPVPEVIKQEQQRVEKEGSPLVAKEGGAGASKKKNKKKKKKN